MWLSRHFGSYKMSKLSVTKRKGRYSAVMSSQLSWAGQYKKCVQYVKFTLEYSVFSQPIPHLNHCSYNVYWRLKKKFTLLSKNSQCSKRFYDSKHINISLFMYFILSLIWPVKCLWRVIYKQLIKSANSIFPSNFNRSCVLNFKTTNYLLLLLFFVLKFET